MQTVKCDNNNYVNAFCIFYAFCCCMAGKFTVALILKTAYCVTCLQCN